VPMTRRLTNVEQLVEQEITGETEVTGENVPQCHFDHNRSHTDFDFCRQCNHLSKSIKHVRFSVLQSLLI
jgi:hypothetical protein